MGSKILNLESMQNMSIDRIIELYRDGYRLEDNYIQSTGIQSLNPDPVVLYSQAYETGFTMTVDMLVRSHNTNTLVVKFEIYSDDDRNRTNLLRQHVACIQPYNTVQNADGCTKIRLENIPLKNPYDIYVYRCLDTPNCTDNTCVSFDANYDSMYYAQMGVVTWTGTAPPLSEFPPSEAPGLNFVVDCASCNANWICETTGQDNTGYKYDTCTGQRVQDLAMCPLPLSVVQSRISITADKQSPFAQGDIITFSGTLESAIDSSNIEGETVRLEIMVGGTRILNSPFSLTTAYGTAKPNFTYNWVVPSEMVGVDTSGMAVTAIVDFYQTTNWTAATAVADYAIAGATCDAIVVTADKTTANVGDLITITSLVTPTASEFPTIVNVDGFRLGTCTTIPSSLSPLAMNGQQIKSMQNSISIISSPLSVAPGEVVNFQIYCDYSVSWFGEWVKFRICSGGNEIGSAIRLLFGTSSGTTSVDATIPINATGSVSLTAEVTEDEFSSTCGDNYVMATSAPRVVPVAGVANTMSIINPPTSVVAGQTVDIQLSYNVTVDSWGEWVRFRICDSLGGEIGSNKELLFGDNVSTITVSTIIPSDTIGSIIIHGEVTTDENNSNCGDQSVVARTSDRTISVTTQISGTISIIDHPTRVRAGQSVDFKVGYNVTVSDYGEWVRFRICSGNTEIGHYIDLFFGSATGIATLNSRIPSSATGTITLKAEVTTSDTYASCGDSGVFATSSTVGIDIITGQPGTCQLVWNTAGMSGGDHYVTAQVLGKCSTVTPLTITLVAPPEPCTSISIGVLSGMNPIVGDIVILRAVATPTLSTLNVTFKANNTIIGSGGVTSGGSCTTNWNTTGLAPGLYKLHAVVLNGGQVQCASSLLNLTLSSTTPTCTSITAVTATPTAATIGGTISLVANVQPATTIFPVEFKDQNNVTLCTISTVAGVATCSWNTTGKTAGPYNIKAFVGQCQSPTATAVTLTAPATCTSITVPTAQPTTLTVGQVTTLSATVAPTTSVFTVDFKDQNNNVLGSANSALNTGIATFVWNTSGKTAGTYNIKAYTGTCSSSAARVVTLNAAVASCTSITTVTATPTAATIGGTIALIATAQPATSILPVSFKDQSNNVLGTANTVNGVATLSWNTTGKTAGSYNIKAYTGTCVSSTATAVTLSTPSTSCTSLTIPTATPATVTVGQSTILSTTVAPSTTSFTVDFKDQNNNVIGSANSNTTTGVASYTWNTAGVLTGTYQIKSYVGSTCISTSAVPVTISPSATVCTNVTTPVAMPSTVALGGILALRATVQPSTSVFTVNFKDQNNNVIGSANTRSGIATYNWNTSGQSAGTYQVKAYVGNTCISQSAVTVTITGGGGVGSITFTTTASGVPLAGVEITVDSTVRGITGSNGTLLSPVSGLTLGITHLYSATIQGYAIHDGSKLLTTDTDVTIDMAAGVSGGGSSAIIGLIGIAALGLMMSSKKPPSSGLVGVGKAPIE